MHLSLTLLMFLAVASAAQTVQGNVRNGTTGMPAPGQQVVLLAQIGELARAITDKSGTFHILLSTKPGPHTPTNVRVTYDGIDYYQSIHPGQRTTVNVYDASTQVRGISGFLTILQFQAEADKLQVTELHAFSNNSDPPTTTIDPNNLVISIPERSSGLSATVSGPDGGAVKLPVISIPERKNMYRIEFPMKPGLTKYAVNYEIPYSGQFVFRRQTQYPMKRVCVIIPKAMRFQSLGGNLFHSVSDHPGIHEQVLDGLGADQSLTFKLSGTGALSQFFRPLTPGEPSVATKSKVLTVQGPRPEDQGANASTAPPRTAVGTPQIVLAIGILALAGILIVSVLRKSNSKS